MNDHSDLAAKIAERLYMPVSEDVENAVLGEVGKLRARLSQASEREARQQDQLQRLTFHLLNAHPEAFSHEYGGNVAGAAIATLDRQGGQIRDLEREIADLLFQRSRCECGSTAPAPARRNAFPCYDEDYPSIDPPTHQDLIAMLGCLQITRLQQAYRNGWRPTFTEPFSSDEHGYRAEFTVPPGVMPAEIVAQQQELADLYGLDSGHIDLGDAALDLSTMATEADGVVIRILHERSSA
ncbi:hypothetical protein [Sciscionella sediminilitoris]|uniref:hypothetical protein n=1 Tax=Sciscionella sediminilitoris TaxID=1445613 RepID=UPI0004DECEA1|nr:hypothetical protein [Sciscionella sp. SE31]